jgi:hypothetical protein
MLQTCFYFTSARNPTHCWRGRSCSALQYTIWFDKILINFSSSNLQISLKVLTLARWDYLMRFKYPNTLSSEDNCFDLPLICKTEGTYGKQRFSAWESTSLHLLREQAIAQHWSWLVWWWSNSWNLVWIWVIGILPVLGFQVGSFSIPHSNSLSKTV